MANTKQGLEQATKGEQAAEDKQPTDMLTKAVSPPQQSPACACMHTTGMPQGQSCKAQAAAHLFSPSLHVRTHSQKQAAATTAHNLTHTHGRCLLQSGGFPQPAAEVSAGLTRDAQASSRRRHAQDAQLSHGSRAVNATQHACVAECKHLHRQGRQQLTHGGSCSTACHAAGALRFTHSTTARCPTAPCRPTHSGAFQDSCLNACVGTLADAQRVTHKANRVTQSTPNNAVPLCRAVQRASPGSLRHAQSTTQRKGPQSRAHTPAWRTTVSDARIRMLPLPPRPTPRSLPSPHIVSAPPHGIHKHSPTCLQRTESSAFQFSTVLRAHTHTHTDNSW